MLANLQVRGTESQSEKFDSPSGLTSLTSTPTPSSPTRPPGTCTSALTVPLARISFPSEPVPASFIPSIVTLLISLIGGSGGGIGNAMGVIAFRRSEIGLGTERGE